MSLFIDFVTISHRNLLLLLFSFIYVCIGVSCFVQGFYSTKNQPMALMFSLGELEQEEEDHGHEPKGELKRVKKKKKELVPAGLVAVIREWKKRKEIGRCWPNIKSFSQ